MRGWAQTSHTDVNLQICVCVSDMYKYEEQLVELEKLLQDERISVKQILNKSWCVTDQANLCVHWRHTIHIIPITTLT